MARIAAQEGSLYQALRALAIHLDLNRREGLRPILVLEAIDVVLGRETARSVRRFL